MHSLCPKSHERPENVGSTAPATSAMCRRFGYKDLRFDVQIRIRYSKTLVQDDPHLYLHIKSCKPCNKCDTLGQKSNFLYFCVQKNVPYVQGNFLC